MHLQSASPYPDVRVTASSRHVEAGTYRLPKAQHHRIMVHASAATRTYCNDVAKHFIRRAGDVDIVPAGREAGFEAETSFDTLEIRLTPSLLEGVAAELGTGASLRRFDTRHLLRDMRIQYLAQALESDLKAGLPSGPLFADSVGVALAVRLLGLDDPKAERTVRLSHDQLSRVVLYIDANLHEALTIDELSRVAGASSSHLRTWFKAAMGTTLHRYVLRRRVDRARTLLLEGDNSISEVAHLTGFAHQSHLAHWMRREIGETPRGLRRAKPVT